jgi:hypothetical protein
MPSSEPSLMPSSEPSLMPLRQFSDKPELREAVVLYLGDQDAWAAADCTGTPCGDYGYAKLLSCECARGENKVLNGGSPFAFASTIIAGLRSMTGMSVVSRTSVLFSVRPMSLMAPFVQRWWGLTNPLVTGMSPVVPTL